ncbi:hypothetical protein [Neisseria sp. CCUG12390]
MLRWYNIGISDGLFARLNVGISALGRFVIRGRDFQRPVMV